MLCLWVFVTYIHLRGNKVFSTPADDTERNLHVFTLSTIHFLDSLIRCLKWWIMLIRDLRCHRGGKKGCYSAEPTTRQQKETPSTEPRSNWTHAEIQKRLTAARRRRLASRPANKANKVSWKQREHVTALTARLHKSQQQRSSDWTQVGGGHQTRISNMNNRSLTNHTSVGFGLRWRGPPPVYQTPGRRPNSAL